MHVEILTALNFIEKLTGSQFSKESMVTFKRTLYERLNKRFEGHWFVDQPHRGCAFRCVDKTTLGMDCDLTVAAQAAGIDFRHSFPPSFTVWIDPGEVSARIGDLGQGSVFNVPLDFNAPDIQPAIAEHQPVALAIQS